MSTYFLNIVKYFSLYGNLLLASRTFLWHIPRVISERKTTLKDVARLAKVSSATVSRVASGNPQVDPQIQSAVHAAAKKLGIDLTDTRKNRTIAFLLGNRDTVNEFQSRILLGAESYCAQHNWDLQFVSFRCDLYAPPANLLLPEALTRPNRASGVILSGTHSVSILSALRERRIPFSVVGNNIVGEWRPEEFDCVSTDDVRGAAEMTQHLISQGHRAIWFIGNQRLPWFERCAEGYSRTMKEAGLEPHFSEIRSEDRELGYLAIKSLLASGERPTGIFAGTDEVASGVYQALQESGILIPDDISVAGFNDTLGELLHPGLTTAREFPKELGSHLAEFTLRRIRDPNLPPQQLTVPTELVRRESVRRIDSRRYLLQIASARQCFLILGSLWLFDSDSLTSLFIGAPVSL